MKKYMKPLLTLLFIGVYVVSFAQQDTIVDFVESKEYQTFFGADYPFLKEAEKKYMKGNITMNQGLKIRNEAQQYKQEMEAVIDQKRIKELEKKWKETEEEGQKLQLDAYKEFADANNDKMKIYNKFFKHSWPNLSPIKTVEREKLRIKSVGSFERAQNYRRVSEKFDMEKKLDNYYKADSLELSALKDMESFLKEYFNQQVKQKEIPNFRETPEFDALFASDRLTLKRIAKLEFQGDSLIAMGQVLLIQSEDQKKMEENIRGWWKKRKARKKAEELEVSGYKYQERGYETLEKARITRYSLYNKYLSDLRVKANPNQLKKGVQQEKEVEGLWITADLNVKNAQRKELSNKIPLYKTADSLRLIVLSNLERVLGIYVGYDADKISTDVELALKNYEDLENQLENYADTLGGYPYWVEQILRTTRYIDSEKETADKVSDMRLKRMYMERILGYEKSIARTLKDKTEEANRRNETYFRKYKNRIATLGSIDKDNKYYDEGLKLQREIERDFQHSRRNIQNAYVLYETKLIPELQESKDKVAPYIGFNYLEMVNYKVTKMRMMMLLLESEKLDTEDTIKVGRLYNLYSGISLGDQLKVEGINKQKEKEKKQTNKSSSNNKKKYKSNANIYFSIQIASYEKPANIPDKSEFRGYKEKEVRRENLHNGTAFVVGKLNYYDTPDELRRAIRNGYTDAYKVAYNNGIRIPMDEARAILRGDKKYTGKPVITAADKPLRFNKKLASKTVKSKPVTELKGVFYSVFIGTYGDKVKWKTIHNITPVYTEVEGNSKKYYAGLYHNKNTAISVIKAVKKAGFPNAYVVAFKDGKRVGLDDVGASTVKTNTAIEGVVFEVQIAAGKSEPSPTEIAQFERLKQYGQLNKRKTSTGYTIYSIGKFNSFTDANNARNKIVSAGVRDAFVIALKDGVEIPINNAINNKEK